MAMRSNGPITLSLPAFRGVTRRLILLSLAGFFGLAILGLVEPGLSGTLLGLVVLEPGFALHRLIWQFITYPFFDLGLLSLAFALLSVWFFGSALEDERGSRWLAEYFLVTTIAGGLLSALLTAAAAGHIPGLAMESHESGMWPFVLALVLAYASFHAEQELRFNFILTLKAKYLAAIYLLFYLGAAVIGSNRFGALVALCSALCGWGYLRWAPRRGLGAGWSEWNFGLRNRYSRWKRRRAARKFTVYMRKQGREVSLDEDGRYIDPLARRGDRPGPRGVRRDDGPHDPNDRRWMN